MINLLSSLLFGELINCFTLSTNNLKKIQSNYLRDSIGILIHINRKEDEARGHAFAFYTCNNIKKVCNNDFIFNLNWLEFFETINDLIENKIDYKIHFDMNKYGLFIKTDQKFISFIPSKHVICMNYLSQEPDTTHNVREFTFLVPESKSQTNFIHNNHSMYLKYYTNKEQNDNSINFINQNNLLDYQDYNGNTPLHLVCSNTNLILLDRLLKLYQGRVNIFIKNNSEESPFTILYNNFIKYSSNQEYGLMIQKIIDYCIVNNIVDETGKTILHIILIYKHKNITDFINYIIEQKPSLLQIKDLDGNTPLDLACINKNQKIVTLLVRKIKQAGYTLSEQNIAMCTLHSMKI